jgi:ECF transporter S component (folate family)
MLVRGSILVKFLNFLGIRDTLAAFRNVRTLTLMAMLIALTVIGYGLLKIEPIQGVRVSFGFVFLAAIAYLFGPVAAFFAGVAASMLAFLMFPAGASFNPLIDLNRGLAGILYAVFLYRRNPKSKYFIIWIVTAQTTVNFICNVIINTYLLILMGWINSDAANIITTVRIFRNVVFMPVEIIIMFVAMKFLAYYAQRYNFVKPESRSQARK